MAEITGIPIAAVDSCGCSDDGKHVWMKLHAPNGSEHIQIFPSELMGIVIQALQHIAGEAHKLRAGQNPPQAESDNVPVVPVKEMKLTRSENYGGWTLQVLTKANLPISLGLPSDVLRQLTGEASSAA